MNVLQNFEILSFLGEGAFGVVKLGKDKRTKEKVAIKILEKKKILSKEDEIRVKREIEILKKSNHINVIRAKKILKDSENIYIIMEYCEKGELFEHIVDEICLNGKESAYYFYQLINGLESLHKNGIVHRDLKPENLLINKSNILKIIDFGLSNYYDSHKLLSTPCGSPCYASPEMLERKNYDGISVDIWTTGIILYAMLCGCLPFGNENHDILYKKILECQITFPPNLGEDAIDLIKKILVINPKERISIKDIKKHPFYQKGRKEFIRVHQSLIIVKIKKYDNKKDDKDKNIQEKEYKNINGIYEELKDNKEKNININKRNKIKYDNFRKNKKSTISNLTIKNDKNNLSEQKIEDKKISNHINNINRKIYFNKKQDNQKEIRKIPKPSNGYNSLTAKGTKKIINLFFQKNAEDNSVSNQNMTKTTIISEYNTLDNKNKINNKNFSNSRNFKKLFRNNNFSVNNKIINFDKFANGENNDFIPKHRNKLNKNFNELKHRSINTQPENYSFFIENMKYEPYYKNNRNLKKNQINKFFSRNINEGLKENTIMKLNENIQKNKGKIIRSSLERKRNNTFSKIIDISDYNKDYNERKNNLNNNTEHFNFNNFNIETLNNGSDLNSYIIKNYTKKINDNYQIIKNQYNTIIYSNIINNMVPASVTINNEEYKSKINQNINFNIKNKPKNKNNINNVKKKFQINNYKVNQKNIKNDKTISNNAHNNKLIFFTESSNYFTHNNNDIIYKRLFETDRKSLEKNTNKDYINSRNNTIKKGLESNNHIYNSYRKDINQKQILKLFNIEKNKIFLISGFNQKNNYIHNIDHLEKILDNSKNNLYKEKIPKNINENFNNNKINKNSINPDNKNNINNNFAAINSRNIFKNSLTINNNNSKLSKNGKRVKINGNQYLKENLNEYSEITNINNKIYKTLEERYQDKNISNKTQHKFNLNENTNRSLNNYKIKNNMLDLNYNSEIKNKSGFQSIRNNNNHFKKIQNNITKNVSNLLDNKYV